MSFGCFAFCDVASRRSRGTKVADLDLSAIVREEADAARPTLGDGLKGLASLEPGSVGLVLSDLPSGETAAKFDRKIAPPDLPVFWARVWKALKPSGCAVLFASSLKAE